MDITVKPRQILRGEIKVEGDKSVSHRALMFNGIADGTAQVTNLARGVDVMNTLRAMVAMGVKIELDRDSNSCTVEGVGMNGLQEPHDILNSGNSGTTTRLLCGILAARDMLAIVSGDESLNQRDMARIVSPLQAAGAKIKGRGGDRYAPLVFYGGNIESINFRLTVPSAQVKSGLLLAGLRADAPSTLTNLGETRDHTERMLKTMGAKLDVSGDSATITPSELRATDCYVPGDISSAVFWIVAALIHPRAELTIKDVGTNPTRSAVLTALERMGAKLKLENRRESGIEPVADITVSSSRLKAIKFSARDVRQMIDEIPILALAAVFSEGTTEFMGIAELRHKESDRVRSTVDWLERCGVTCAVGDDNLTIEGQGYLSGATCSSFGDHRVAMTLGIAGLVAREPLTIIDADASKTSYHSFWEDLERVAYD